jgi:hypothetical protein
MDDRNQTVGIGRVEFGCDNETRYAVIRAVRALETIASTLEVFYYIFLLMAIIAAFYWALNNVRGEK